MGLLQYDKAFLDSISESGTSTDRGMVVMDAIDDDDLDQLRRHMAETEGDMFRAASGASRPYEYRPRQTLQTFADGDDSEEAVFAFGCK